MSGLNANAVMIFTDYQVQDNDLTTLHFICNFPGPGQPTDYYISFTDAQIQAIGTAQQAIAAVTAALQRKYRSSIATTLNSYIGQSITI
jgi:hypothetical protein